MQKQIIQWLAEDELVGLSSKCMAFVIGFDVIPKRKNYPMDVSDFSRCYHLLEQVPQLRAGLFKMKAVSPIWANLIDHWEELEQAYQSEKGQSKCPKTYKLIEKLTRNDPNVIFKGNGFSIRMN